MEFFAGAQEIGGAPVDGQVIDGGLLLVRQLWDAGLAHRDIKPANLMVRAGKVLLVDAFFVQVRQRVSCTGTSPQGDLCAGGPGRAVGDAHAVRQAPARGERRRLRGQIRAGPVLA